MPEAVWCQIKESSAPVELGFKHCICSARSGKSSSILCLFHLSSEVSRSATVRSRADSLIGPIGFRILSNEIQESFQILAVCPFPIDFPRFSFKRSRPWSILFYPWEQLCEGAISRKLLLWQYFPMRIREKRLSGAVIIRQASFANRA